MPLVEGVGDEVIQFVAIVVIVAVAALAWWSTNARPDRYRTVLVMRSRTHHPVTVSIRTSTNTTEPTEDTSNNARVVPLQEMDSIVDADMAMLDHNRLHFYRRIDTPTTAPNVAESTSDESEAPEESEPASTAQIQEMDRIVSAMEADVTAGCEFFARPSEANASTATEKKDGDQNAQSTDNVDRPEIPAEGTDTASSEPSEENRRKILIKLKYLNDTLKEVEGSLDELLKDFKWRHFSTELSSECRVRLIFNGRVLVDDAATLRACGLHDRAVVHCLVHPKRVASQQRGIGEEVRTETHELLTDRPVPERTWDLENILMTLVSVALTVLWFFRCEYSTMFTASASVALFGLTVFYSVAIFGLYLSDTFHLERRPTPAPQPVPNN